MVQGCFMCVCEYGESAVWSVNEGHACVCLQGVFVGDES